MSLIGGFILHTIVAVLLWMLGLKYRWICFFVAVEFWLALTIALVIGACRGVEFASEVSMLSILLGAAGAVAWFAHLEHLDKVDRHNNRKDSFKR